MSADGIVQASPGRQRLEAGAWRLAAAFLGAGADPGRRGDRLAVRLGLSGSTGSGDMLAACRQLPEWIGWPEAERDRATLLAGVSVNAVALAACLDGRVLQQVAGWIGEAALEHLLDLADGDAPGPGDLPAGEAECRQAGRGLLRASLPAWPALIDRLGLGDATDPAMPPETACIHADRAVALVQLERETGS